MGVGGGGGCTAERHAEAKVLNSADLTFFAYTYHVIMLWSAYKDYLWHIVILVTGDINSRLVAVLVRGNALMIFIVNINNNNNSLFFTVYAAPPCFLECLSPALRPPIHGGRAGFVTLNCDNT